MANLHFYKFHGAGNDFILLDGRMNLPELSGQHIKELCNRHFGIGSDGLIVLQSAAGFHFSMTYYNSDGNESTMCGNGGRCIVAFADFLSLIENQADFLAVDGRHEAHILARGLNSWHVKLKMNDVKKIGQRGADFVADTGSPHLVRFMDDLGFEDIRPLARTERYHPDFAPGGINVNFVREIAGGIEVRTYERGVEDETLSCGTGVTASALVYARIKGLKDGTIPVTTRGGELSVSFKSLPDGGFSDIWLEGPAVKAFEGILSFEF